MSGKGTRAMLLGARRALSPESHRATALVLTVLCCCFNPSATGAQQDDAQQNPGRNVDWTDYAGDLSASRYKPLGQINATNFSDLEVAWRFKTDNIGNHPEYKLEGTPLEVGGIVYATAGSRRGVVALDATTGELLWVHGEHEGARGAAAPRQLSGRGLGYWSDGKDGRILYVTPGFYLVALDARTGQRIASFGQDGRVDMKADDDQRIEPDLTTGEIGWQSAPTVVNDTVLIGSAFREGFTPDSFRNNKGSARAYDVRTGRKLWEFHTIAQHGEPGNDSWLDGSAEYTGNTGVWTEISADAEAGLAYLPVESPTSDFYGGRRPGANLYGDALVAVDLKSGRMKWYFQFIHHEIWDYDMSSAPLLIDITVAGKPIKAVAEPTKQGMLYVFDRLTGQPVWPIVERPAPRGDVPGEWYAPTQPIPTRPMPYARTGVGPDDLIDFTPELHQKALALVKDFKLGPLYTPPVASRIPPAGPVATLMVGPANGGTNWPGGSFNPINHTVYVYACNACLLSVGLVTPPAGMSDLPYVVGEAGQQVARIEAAGSNQGADAQVEHHPRAAPAVASAAQDHPLTVDGLPLLKPPYSTITAIDLDTGNITWQVAHGETPDYIRNSPALQGLNIPRTGVANFNIGTLLTRDLVIAGDAVVTTTHDHPRGAMLRAYDQKTGREVGSVLMPAPQSGSPMTYSVNGKQYIVVAVSGGNYSGEYISYTLPEDESSTHAAAPEAGGSLWNGVYTSAQAKRGAAVYQQSCAACHLASLAGNGVAPALRGGQFLAHFSGLTVGDLFDRIRATMPLSAPGSLSRRSYADILTYMLQANDFPPSPGRELDYRSEYLKGIRFETNSTQGSPLVKASSPVQDSPPAQASPPAPASKLTEPAPADLEVLRRANAESGVLSATASDPRNAADSQPNPYSTHTDVLHLPPGRKMGSTSAVAQDSRGHIWVAERCGDNSCAGSSIDPILEFDASGTFLKAFGAGLFVFPHGLFIDKEDHIWVTDTRAAAGKGADVLEFDANGKVLRTLGKPGVQGDGPDTFGEPSAVVVAPDGTIFVADGHEVGPGHNARIVKFDRNGKFLMQWGSHGTAPGHFDAPHCLAMDREGRLYVGDRWNNRIQVFDQTGRLLQILTQFGRPSGMYIDSRDVLYVSDSESHAGPGYGHHPGWHRGIRVGSVRDGIVTAFIPDTDSEPETSATSGGEGIWVAGNGTIYSAQVKEKAVVAYVGSH